MAESVLQHLVTCTWCFVLATGVAFSTAKEDAQMKLTISSLKKTYKMGEPIQVGVRVSNESKKTLSLVSLRRSIEINRFGSDGTIIFKVLNENEHDVYPNQWTEINDNTSYSMNVVELAPGDSLDGTFLIAYFWPPTNEGPGKEGVWTMYNEKDLKKLEQWTRGRPGLKKLAAPPQVSGKYRIMAQYCAADALDLLNRNSNAITNGIRDILTSNALEIEILSAEEK